MGNDQAASSQPSSVIFLKTGVLVSAGSEIEENVVLPMLLELFFLHVTERQSGIDCWNSKLALFRMGWDPRLIVVG